MKYAIAVVVWLALMVGLTVAMTKAGSPQQVWFFCDKLGWCAPKQPPYCPPDPKECE